MPAERGFTLIEILVVVLIIGITLGFALLAFGDFGVSRHALVTAEQFISYIKLVQQQAMLETRTLGIKINQDSYSTYRFERDGWQSFSTNTLFHQRSFAHQVIVRSHSHEQHSKKPDIIINASGDIAEFTIYFGTIKKSNIVTLVGKRDGQLVIEHPT